jgi:hypothetical protein
MWLGLACWSWQWQSNWLLIMCIDVFEKFEKYDVLWIFKLSVKFVEFFCLGGIIGASKIIRLTLT